MKKVAILFLISTFLAVTSSAAQAFDGKRKGFQIGLGIGSHTTELNYKSNFAPSSIDSKQKFAFSMSLGFGFSNQIVGYVGGKGGTILIDDRYGSFTMGGFGASVYLKEQSPSLYITGLIGSAIVAIDGEPDDSHDTGDGWIAGIGYEVTDQLHLELSHARADLADPFVTANSSTLESTFLTLQYIWY